MKFAVVDVAAEHGGAMAVLRSFVEAAGETESEWVVYLSALPMSAQDNITFRRFPWVKRSWLHRLWFDIVTVPREVRKDNPDAILSLQNLTVPRWRGPQIVYLHQSLPFASTKYKISRHPKLWIYQNLIGGLIRGSVRRARVVIVQTDWMRRAVISLRGVDPAKVVVVRSPRVARLSGKNKVVRGSVFFYPASAEPYKNHRVILEASRLLEERGIEFEVLLTVTPKDLRRSCKTDVPTSIRPVGRLSPDEVQAFYRRSILIFPSLIESLALPLAEASDAGSLILASDLPYSREALELYPNAYFFRPESAKELADMMETAVTVGFDCVECHRSERAGSPGFAQVIRVVEEASCPRRGGGRDG